MARLVREVGKDGRSTGKTDAVKEASRKPPMKTVYIHHGDFVQIVAKVSGEAVMAERMAPLMCEIGVLHPGKCSNARCDTALLLLDGRTGKVVVEKYGTSDMQAWCSCICKHCNSAPRPG
jgi:hypothetical protein